MADASRIHPDPEKIKATADIPKPHGLMKVRSFLRLVHLYRNFIQNFSVTAKPLHKLLHKGNSSVWETGQEDAFTKLQQSLLEAPIPVYPDFKFPFVLHTDACAAELDAVLMQERIGKLHPTAYVSRSFSPAESNY